MEKRLAIASRNFDTVRGAVKVNEYMIGAGILAEHNTQANTTTTLVSKHRQTDNQT